MMKPIDKTIFGDNQFFGINHMSQEKAQKLADRFSNIEEIFKVYDQAFDAGIGSIMLNSNDRAIDICNHFRGNKEKYKHLNWYPSLPYPHKYANLVAEKGIPKTVNDILIQNYSLKGAFGMIVKSGAAVVTKDVIKLMQMFIDIDMKMFEGLNVKVVFLQNIITDLLLGYDFQLIFNEFAKYIRKKYNAIPGFITQNMPILLNKLHKWNIDEVAICTSFNKLGYLMSPNINSYINAANNNNPNRYQLMAMSTLASGAIEAREAYSFINNQNIQSIVFGASTKSHIKETTKLISI